jgi:hypothetical protein
MDKLGSLFSWISKLNPTVIKIGLGIAAFAAVVGPLILALGMLAASISSMITLFSGIAAIMAGAKIGLLGLTLLFAKFIAIATLVAGAAYLIYKNWEPIKQFFSDLADIILNPIDSLKTLMGYIGKVSGISKLFGVESVDDKLRAQGFNIAGPDTGAQAVVKSESKEQKVRDAKASISVDFSNAPPWLKTEKSGDLDIINYKSGIQGF